MPILSKPLLQVLQHPLAFALETLKGFKRNQGMLLAGAMAYYALLSILPLLTLSVIGLSHLVDQALLLETLGRYLEWLVPSQSQAVLADISGFLENRVTIGVALLVTMLFFSAQGFTVLEKAMGIIFAHRQATKKRHFLVSAALPYCFVLLLFATLLGVSIVSIALQALAEQHIYLLGQDWSLVQVSGVLLYLLGLGMETLILTAIYRLIPVGRTRLRHALIGGLTAALLWELTRHVLIWYFVTVSNANIVYGSLSTAVVLLFSMEIAAALLLLGAQVISEYERLAEDKPTPAGSPSNPLP